MRPSPQILQLVENEWETDRVNDDVTVRLLKEKAQTPAKAIVKTREAGVFSGDSVVEAYRLLLPNFKVEAKVHDGDPISPGQELLRLSGTVGECLSLERTLLNFLSHLCGIATITQEFVRRVEGTGTRILATRKTLPGLRDLQLQAVVAGGGRIHRRSLADGILIKDNHLAYASETALLAAAQETRSPLHGVEIEVQSLASLDRALVGKADVIMLDNLSPEEMKEAVRRIGKAAEIEISGGVTLETVGELAKLGAHSISIGRLTHSVRALDLTLEFLT